MAKTSKIAAQARREDVVARRAEQRAALKETQRQAAARGDLDGAIEAGRALARLPRDASPTRLRNRDATDGRPRGFVRKAGISRVRFRELAHRGELPGIRKSSW